MKTQAIEVQQGRRGEVIVRQQRRRPSVTAWLLLAPIRLLAWLTRGMARRGWSNRWHLTPLVGGAWVLTYGAASPLATSSALALAGTLSAVWAWRGKKVGGRMFLSVLERAALAEGLFGAGLWVAGEWAAAAAGVRTPAVLDLAAYALCTGHAAGVWWWSRRPVWMRREPKDARLYTGQWDTVAATATAFGSSYVRKDTVEVLRTDDVTFRVRLGEDHHAEDVADAERRAVERLIKGPKGADLPPGAVAIAGIDTTVNEVQVTISPQRASLTEPLDWPGVEPIPANGKTTVSREPSGRPVDIQQFAESGPHNVTAIGGSKGGKTSTLRTFLLRGPATLNDRGQPIETIWTLDGGKGTSAPELAHAFDIYAIQPSWFPIVFEAWCAIHLGREARRGDPRNARSSYRVWEEEDQILTLCLLEAPGVTRVLTSAHDRAFAEAMQRIRKLGQRVVLDTQELTRNNIPGGDQIETVRNQLFNNGVVLAHRIGSADKRALESSGDASRLTKQQNALPPGGGWHIAMQEGQLLSARTRSLWAPEERSRAEADRITPRPLDPADLEIACRVPGFRELYEHRHNPLWTPPQPDEETDQPDAALVSGPRPFVPVQSTKELADVRVLRAITEHMAKTGDPLGKTQAGLEPPEGYGIPGATWELGRTKLQAEGKIHQPVVGKWAPTFPKGS